MQEIKEKFFEGEHALYGLSNASLENVTFGNGESPLKETKDLVIKNNIFNINILYGIQIILKLLIVHLKQCLEVVFGTLIISPLKTLIYKFLSCLEDVNIFH